TLVFSTLPTLDQRNGILTVDVRDPLTGNTYKAGTAVSMSHPPRKVVGEVPAPKRPGPDGKKYQNLVPNRAYNDKFNVRLDHKISDNLNTFARISHRKVNNFEGPNIPGPSGSNQNGIVYVLNQQLAAGATYIFHNTSSLDVRLGIS